MLFRFAMTCVALTIAVSAPAATRHTNRGRNEPQQAAQTEPQSQTANGAARGNHKVKVWTNDELASTRTPMDRYIFEKEANAAATANAAFNEIMSCFVPTNTEGSAAETQREIDETLQEVGDSEDAVAQAKRALNDAPAGSRLRNQLELAQRTAELNHAREKLWKLQEHLKEVRGSEEQKTQASPGEPVTPAGADPTEQAPTSAKAPYTDATPPVAPN